MRYLLCCAVAVAAAALAQPVSTEPPLRLEVALERSHQHQPALKVAQAQVDAASARTSLALAPWLPQVSAALAYSRSTANFVARPGAVPTSLSAASSLSAQSFDFFTGSLNVQQLLWDFGQVWNSWDAAKATVDAQVATQRAAVVTSDLQVRTAYFAAAAQRDLVAVARASLDNAKAHLAQVETFVKVGTRPAIDLAQSRADYANARLALVNATNASTVARARLNLAMGVEGSTSYELADSQLEPVDLEQRPVDDVLAVAVAARPELAAFDAQLRAQALTLRSLRAAFWPTLNAQGSLTVQARSLAAPTPNGSLGVNLAWQPYQGGQTQAQIASAEATLAQLAAQRDVSHGQVRLDVEQALLDVGAAREALEVSHEALAATQEQQRLAEGRYNAGAGSMLEWADAQVRVTAAAAQQVQASFALATARARLLAALGR